MMSSKRAAAILAFVAVAALMLAPLFAEDNSGLYAGTGDVKMGVADNPISVGAGQNRNVAITFTNTSTTVYLVSLTVAGTGGLNAEFNPNLDSITLKSGETQIINLTLGADQYARAGTENVTVTMTYTNMALPPSTPESLTFPVTVSSELSSSSQFNKLLGIFENPLPYPMNTPAFTAGLSFVLWMAIALFVILVMFLVVRNVFSEERKREFDELKENVSVLIFLLIVVYGISGCLRIGGVEEYYVAMALSVSAILYIILGAIISWRVYKIIVAMLFRNIKSTIEGIDDTLVPLFHVMGRITIGTIAVAAILAALGFNFMAILTGAGIAGLALSLGAQSTLNQFFSGMNLLITRPFKAGDLVKMKEHTAILRVRKIGMMNTVFDSWENEEVVVMPNSLVASTVITNMSGKNRVYRILIWVGVGYGENLDAIMKIMRDVAYNHPRVIKDGTFDTPDTRVMEFADYDIKIRLSVYVDDVEDHGTIGAQIRLQIYEKLAENGIEIPVPQMDVHLTQ